MSGVCEDAGSAAGRARSWRRSTPRIPTLPGCLPGTTTCTTAAPLAMRSAGSCAGVAADSDRLGATRRALRSARRAQPARAARPRPAPPAAAHPLRPGAHRSVLPPAAPCAACALGSPPRIARSTTLREPRRGAPARRGLRVASQVCGPRARLGRRLPRRDLGTGDTMAGMDLRRRVPQRVAACERRPHPARRSRCKRIASRMAAVIEAAGDR